MPNLEFPRTVEALRRGFPSIPLLPILHVLYSHPALLFPPGNLCVGLARPQPATHRPVFPGDTELLSSLPAINVCLDNTHAQPRELLLLLHSRTASRSSLCSDADSSDDEGLACWSSDARVPMPGAPRACGHTHYSNPFASSPTCPLPRDRQQDAAATALLHAACAGASDCGSSDAMA